MPRVVRWWEPVFTDAEKAAVARVIDSGFVNDGEVTRELERRFAAMCGTPYAVATTSGTAAIFLALAAQGVSRGDEVIVPDFTFIATANAVSLTGATPILVDIDPDTLCISPSAVERHINSRTRAIVPVHVSGRAAAMPGLLEIARAHRLMVVEDAAEALGSRCSLGALGGIGNAGCFSLTANKTITSGQGGVVVTHDPGVHRRLRELKDQGRPRRGTGGDDAHPSLGYNFKFTDIQAAVALAQLDTLSWRLERLKAIYHRYCAGLSESRQVRLVGFDTAVGESPQWVDARCSERDSLVKDLADEGVETRNFWHPIHSQKPYLADGLAFPAASAASRETFWLPSSLTLSNEDIDRVCDLIIRWEHR